MLSDARSRNRPRVCKNVVGKSHQKNRPHRIAYTGRSSTREGFEVPYFGVARTFLEFLHTLGPERSLANLVEKKKKQSFVTPTVSSKPSFYALESTPFPMLETATLPGHVRN